MYVGDQLGPLVTTTKALAAAIDDGDRSLAKLLYPFARKYYERVEPVAEIFGTLDLQIDGRINDFVPRSAFTGIHRIEQILWTQPTVDARPVAAQLVRRVTQLQTLAARTHYTSLELTSGATELLTEIETSKITGEEERYSHLDLVDIRGNIDGAEEIITLFTPSLRRFVVKPGYYRSGFRSYTDVNATDRRRLAAVIEALAEAVSLTTHALNG